MRLCGGTVEFGLLLGDSIFGAFGELTGFLRDVRAEMRKVVTPTRKEVRVTTSVVIVAVFIFGLYFFIVDNIFGQAVHWLLGRLGGGLQ